MAKVAFLLRSSGIFRPGGTIDRTEEERAAEDGTQRENFNHPSHGCIKCEFTANQMPRGPRQDV